MKDSNMISSCYKLLVEKEREKFSDYISQNKIT